MPAVTITRSRKHLLPDAGRVLAKPFLPGDEQLLPGESRAKSLIDRILEIPESQIAALLSEVLHEFSSRHRDFEKLLERNFELVAANITAPNSLSAERRRLIGAYFTHEYSVEAAALFNPSLVGAPDQSGLSDGQQRVIMSMRAVGEGHLSSIEFRSGILEADGELCLQDPGRYLVAGLRTPPQYYDKVRFGAKLRDLSADNELSGRVLARLPSQFSLRELENSLTALEEDGTPRAIWFSTLRIIRVLAASNYVVRFPDDSAPSERVLFPSGPNETRGMEDARFVHFTRNDGSRCYYATYTAYDGFNIFPQLIETVDFNTFVISTLHGVAAQNKGMALFPRMIGGKYLMLSRRDRENLFLASSEDVHFWHQAIPVRGPVQPWELLQIGNCGSPLETEAGWLVLTHGVGPMRRYTISALLLDLQDPSRVIGALKEPLLAPDSTEREGYVPNVVYSCGSLIQGDQLILPYGFSDAGISIARVPLSELLTRLTTGG